MASYFIIGGDKREYGPISSGDVRQWIIEGRLNSVTEARAENETEWGLLGSIPEFADLLGKALPPNIGPIKEPFVPGDPQWQADVASRLPDLKLGECLKAGFSFFSTNTGFVLATVFLAWLLNAVLAFGALFIPLIGALAALCFTGVVMGGLYLACLRRMRGETVSPVAAFSGFQNAFGQLVLAGLVSALLTELGFCCFILPCIYLGVAWVFTVPLVADKKMFFWSAMELSRKVVTRVWFEVFVLGLIAFLPILIFQCFGYYKTGIIMFDLYHQSGGNSQQFMQAVQGQMDEIRAMSIKMAALTQVISFFNLLYAVGVLMRAYENLFGDRKP